MSDSTKIVELTKLVKSKDQALSVLEDSISQQSSKLDNCSVQLEVVKTSYDSVKTSLTDSLANKVELLDSIKSIYVDSLQVANDKIASLEAGDFLGLSTDVWIKLFVPLALTIIYTWIKSRLKKKSEVKSYRELFISWLDLTDKALKEQIKCCEEFIERLTSTKNIGSQLFQYTRLHANKTDDIPVKVYMILLL